MTIQLHVHNPEKVGDLYGSQSAAIGLLSLVTACILTAVSFGWAVPELSGWVGYVATSAMAILAIDNFSTGTRRYYRHSALAGKRLGWTHLFAYVSLILAAYGVLMTWTEAALQGAQDWRAALRFWPLLILVLYALDVVAIRTFIREANHWRASGRSPVAGARGYFEQEKEREIATLSTWKLPEAPEALRRERIERRYANEVATLEAEYTAVMNRQKSRLLAEVR